MTPPDPARLCVDQWSQRIASIPDALRQASQISLPSIDGPSPMRIVTTGIGASEGPARLLAAALVDGGIVATFVPLMNFALEPPQGDLLVVFSQNLSPNARLALTAEHRFAARWLVTSVGWVPGASKREPLLSVMRERGVVPIIVPPASEDGMLVRVVGPTVATLVALRIGAQLGVKSLQSVAFDQAPHAYLAPNPADVFDDAPLALVAAGVPVDSLFAARWKVLETLLVPDPSVWDVLQIAHGPLQAFHDRRQTLLVCGVESARGLIERMLSTLVPERHRVITIVSRHSDVLSYFEHAAAVDACLLETLRQRPRDLLQWPGRNADGPLYNLGDD